LTSTHTLLSVILTSLTSIDLQSLPEHKLAARALAARGTALASELSELDTKAAALRRKRDNDGALITSLRAHLREARGGADDAGGSNNNGGGGGDLTVAQLRSAVARQRRRGDAAAARLRGLEAANDDSSVLKGELFAAAAAEWDAAQVAHAAAIDGGVAAARQNIVHVYARSAAERAQQLDELAAVGADARKRAAALSTKRAQRERREYGRDGVSGGGAMKDKAARLQAKADAYARAVHVADAQRVSDDASARRTAAYAAAAQREFGALLASLRGGAVADGARSLTRMVGELQSHLNVRS
jgi:hypothetical protein